MSVVHRKTNVTGGKFSVFGFVWHTIYINSIMHPHHIDDILFFHLSFFFLITNVYIEFVDIQYFYMEKGRKFLFTVHLLPCCKLTSYRDTFNLMEISCFSLFFILIKLLWLSLTQSQVFIP